MAADLAAALAEMSHRLAAVESRLAALLAAVASAPAVGRPHAEDEAIRLLARFDPERLRRAWAQAESGDIVDLEPRKRELLASGDAGR